VRLEPDDPPEGSWVRSFPLTFEAPIFTPS
jgi:hypothetical protein